MQVDRRLRRFVTLIRTLERRPSSQHLDILIKTHTKGRGFPVYIHSVYIVSVCSFSFITLVREYITPSSWLYASRSLTHLTTLRSYMYIERCWCELKRRNLTD